jgi:hypothetical protein
MASFVATHISQIVSAMIGALAGAAISVPISIKITRTSIGDSVLINQAKAKAGGDITGGDKIIR